MKSTTWFQFLKWATVACFVIGFGPLVAIALGEPGRNMRIDYPQLLILLGFIPAWILRCRWAYLKVSGYTFVMTFFYWLARGLAVPDTSPWMPYAYAAIVLIAGAQIGWMLVRILRVKPRATNRGEEQEALCGAS